MLSRHNPKPERTGWRDGALSLRHRRWGFDAPAVDIDFLLIEYSKGEPKAIVEYKNEHASQQFSSHPSYRAMIALGNRANLPVFAVRYTDTLDWYTVTPLNPYGRHWLPEPHRMSESEYVTFLYSLRDNKPPSAETKQGAMEQWKSG